MSKGLYQVGKKLPCTAPLNFTPTKVWGSANTPVASGAAATQTAYFANKKPWDL
jgi:hypothetical protein